MTLPIKDRVAIAGLGSTPFSRDAGRAAGAMVLDACVGAVRDAGLTASDIDGLCGSNVVPARYVQGALGIPECTWHANLTIPFQHQIIESMNAIHAGMCSTVLAYHGVYRASGTSRAASADPFRARYGAGPNVLFQTPDTFEGAVGHSPWARRYLDKYGVGREVFGKVAINNRSNAVLNERAAMRQPLTMEDYLSARLVREPLTLYDMDLPVDGADAFIITSAERARDLPHRPVLIHAAALGQNDRPFSAQMLDVDCTGQQIAIRQLWRHSDVRLGDVDVFFPYDGFSIITVRWFETAGYCDDGEANAFFDAHWETSTDRILIDGRVAVNTHGGSMSEGATQGSGHFREAAAQLRGEAGVRQVPNAKHALVTPGGFFFNAGAVMLRTE
ncbi:MAG: acetyl-CoA acetyltransferase [Acidimicrobiales bacterium]|jgi:acetyl-CoA acetyltransferase|nr:acetyl-CoA acetyltransferase [Acidimicrobiales bacterium]